MNPNDPQQQHWAPQQLPPSPYPYYPPPQVGYEPARNDSEATTIFVLGLVGMTACGICAPIAWAKGSGYRRTCQITGTTPNGLATAGWIMGIIGTILLGISFLFVLLALVLGA